MEKYILLTNNLNVKKYVAIRAFEVPMKRGAVDVSGSIRFNRVGIVNQSNKTLRIDEIIYSSDSNNSSSDHFQDIQSMSIKEVFLKRRCISYFFDDNIPEEIKIRGKLGGTETKYWLHELHE